MYAYKLALLVGCYTGKNYFIKSSLVYIKGHKGVLYCVIIYVSLGTWSKGIIWATGHKQNKTKNKYLGLMTLI